MYILFPIEWLYEMVSFYICLANYFFTKLAVFIKI